MNRISLFTLILFLVVFDVLFLTGKVTPEKERPPSCWKASPELVTF